MITEEELDEWWENRPWYQKVFDYIIYRKNKIIDISYEIKWAWQRVFRGYDDRSVWGTGDWLAKLMPNILEELKTNKQGVPIEFLPTDVGERSFTDEEMEEGRKKFNLVLDEMIAGFKAHTQQDEIPFDGDISKWKKEEEQIMKIRDNGLQLFVKYYDNLWT